MPATRPMIRPIWANEGDVVEIHWRPKDETQQGLFVQPVTMPAKETIAVRHEAIGWGDQREKL